MPKQLTPVKAETQWDEEITELRDRSYNALCTAERCEDWARWFVTTRHYRLADRLFRHAEHQRDESVELATRATRMRDCPDNPRNGGRGFEPTQTFREFCQEIGHREIISTLVWLSAQLALFVVFAGWFIVAIMQNYPPGPDSLIPLVATTGGLLAGVLAVIIIANTIRDIQSLAHFAWDYVWGEPL